MIYVEQKKRKTLLKLCPICLQTKRQKQYCASFFPLTFVVPAFLGLRPGFVVSNRCLLLIFIYLPLLHPHALEVSTWSVLGGGCVRGFACVEMMSALQCE